MKPFTACLVSIIVFFISIFNPAVPEVKTEDELSGLGNICENHQIAETLCVIDAGTFKSTEERHLAVALQGIVAKDKPAIFITTNDISREYLKYIEKSGTKLQYNDSKGNPWTVESLLKKFKGSITDKGYVLYKANEIGEGLNAATNLASLKGWLPVPESLENLAIKTGLTLKEDFSDDVYNIDFQKNFFEKYKDDFEFKAIVSLKYESTGLRDLAIQQGFYMFYIDEDVDGEEGKLFRETILNHAGDNVPVLGWGKYELEYVTQASENGNFVIPSYHSHNNSLLTSFEYEIPLQKKQEVTEYTDTTKHYCALVFSDGDNIQWIQNGYSEYYEKLQLETDFPVTWSFSPTLQEFSPVTVNMIYNAAGENDYFIAGVSGAGYCHPTEYPVEALGEFTDLTAAAMLKSDLKYVSILDNTPENSVDDALLITRLEYYARYDNIKGGVLSLDPDRYAGGMGKVYFADDKPFVSNRFSLWHPDGEGTEITHEWLDEQAAIVNSYEADIDSINGYSVINIHPWTISVEDLSYFVSQLDEDVELVTVDELLTMVEANIPHKVKEPK